MEPNCDKHILFKIIVNGVKEKSDTQLIELRNEQISMIGKFEVISNYGLNPNLIKMVKTLGPKSFLKPTTPTDIHK